MKYVGTAAACGLLASSSLAHAEIDIPGTFSGNIGFASEYVWQGITMSAGGMTVNGGFDWDLGNGWYASVWGSNVDYYDSQDAQYASFYITGGGSTASSPPIYVSDDNAAVEIDTYIGYWGYIGGGYNTPYDIGVGYYMYPGARHGDNTYISGYFNGTGFAQFNPPNSTGPCGAGLGNCPAVYNAWGTGNMAEAYVGIGHYFLDDRVKSFAYLTYTNDYNGQNQDAWSLYDDTDIYLSNAITLKLHAGYNWGEYWRKNLFGYNTNSWLSFTDRSFGWCGYTYALGPNPADTAVQRQADVNLPESIARYNDCIAGSGKDDDWFDWSIGLQRAFGQFDVNVSYVWVTGIDNEDEVTSWWSGMDKQDANEIYVDGKWVASVKMAL